MAELITTLLKLDPPLKVKTVPLEEYVSGNSGGEDLLTKWSTTYPALQRGELAVVDTLLRRIVGRDLLPFEETVKEVLGAGGDVGEAAVQQYSR